jgi:aminoglycoside phosphotransferase (APT) family kinase protein
MAQAVAVTRLLADFGLADRPPLGSGQEADIYGLDDQRVLRIYRLPMDAAHLERMAGFYGELERGAAAFATPSVLDWGVRNGVSFSVERRIGGVSLASALGRLAGEVRRHALRSYVEAAAAIAGLGHPQRAFGEVLADPPIRAGAWADFILARAGAELNQHRGLLEGRIAQPDRAIEALGAMLKAQGAVEPRLVHGDFYPENILIGESGEATGIIDFGGLTLIGDAQLDLACAVFFLTGMASVTADDRALVLGHALGLGLKAQSLALYRLYYAFRFLGARRENDGLLRWCATTIDAACHD